MISQGKGMVEALVTGANGFVGSHICEALIDAGFAVRALVRKTSDLTNIGEVPVRLVYGDLSDPASLAEAVAGTDIVIGNAGLVKALHFDEFHKVNVVGTENIILATLKCNPGIKRFVHISSTAACGPAPNKSPLNETHTPAPLTHYGRSKLEAEKIVLSYKDRLPVVILRPSAVYGPRDKEMRSFFKSVKLGIKPAFGCAQNYVNFTYAKDLARAVVSAISQKTESGSVYFIVEKKSYSYSEAGDILAKTLGRKAHNLYIPEGVIALAGRIAEQIASIRGKPSIFTRDKAIEIAQKYWLFDPSKAERELGFVCPTNFETGAAETIAWYKEKGWL
jgi:nucleoside-diphosphate-sugar epimerase